MMRTTLPITLVLAGCFGNGPVPGQPSQATTVLFVPPAPSGQECNESKYIGQVAFGPSASYAVLMPYTPNNSNCNGGGNPSQTPLQVLQFGGSGGTMMIGTAGNNQGGQYTPRIAGNGTWVFGDVSTNGTLTLGPSGQVITPAASGPGGPLEPTGYLVDGSGAWLAATSNNNGGSSNTIFTPGYPCCGSQPPAGTPTASTITVLPSAGGQSTLPISPMLACETEKHCLIENMTSLFYMVHDMTGNDFSIKQFPKTGTLASDEVELAKVDRSIVGGAAVVVGIAADDQHVAWALTNDLQSTANPPGCWIFTHTLSPQSTQLVFSSTNLSCVDVAVDATYVYFTIVELYKAPDQQEPSLRGRGLGRYSVSGGGMLESIALGLDGDTSGARRVALDSDSVYAVDPLVIGKIAKTAFDGAHDISP
jgi:hypothetical protein